MRVKLVGVLVVAVVVTVVIAIVATSRGHGAPKPVVRPAAAEPDYSRDMRLMQRSKLVRTSP